MFLRLGVGFLAILLHLAPALASADRAPAAFVEQPAKSPRPFTDSRWAAPSLPEPSARQSIIPASAACPKPICSSSQRVCDVRALPNGCVTWRCCSN